MAGAGVLGDKGVDINNRAEKEADEGEGGGSGLEGGGHGIGRVPHKKNTIHKHLDSERTGADNQGQCQS